MIRIFSIFFLVTLCLNSNAQLFSTKSGIVSFFSSTPLEDIKATNSDVESKLLSSTGQLTFMLLVKGFRFPNEMMEDHFNESYLESDKYPKADFKGLITNISNINFLKDGVYPALVKGNLTIHGVTKEVASSGTITIKNGKPTAACKFTVKVRDYNITGKIIGKELAEVVSVSVDCRYE